MRVPRDSIQTQEQQLQDDHNTNCTPDILFVQSIVINGQKLFWMESKYCLVVHDLSPQMMVHKLVKQVKKYTATFGAGAILWTKCGFARSLQDFLFREYGVLCFRQHTLCDNPPGRTLVEKPPILVTCKKCNDDFEFSAKHQFQYKANRWSHPKVCPDVSPKKIRK